VLFRVFWVGAPRWLYTPIYVALGWVAIFYFGPFLQHGGVALVTLIAVGGFLYTLGAIVYGTKKPDPSPRWFGFHEIFHAFTVAAFAAHYIAVSMAIYGA
jgi:hemolysin III